LLDMLQYLNLPMSLDTYADVSDRSGRQGQFVP